MSDELVHALPAQVFGLTAAAQRAMPQTAHLEAEGVSAPRLVVSSHQFQAGKGKSIDKVIREDIVRVGVDLAKRVIQVHAVDAAGRVVTARALPRDSFTTWCAQLPAGCVVSMEACGGAHHWARRLRSMGLQPRLISGQLVGPYRMEGRRGKNDANDAAAVCEAAARPHMRFVPIKTTQQQAILAVHRLREGYKEERTACINRIRGLLTEFGLVFPQSPDALRENLPDVLEDASNELPWLARVALQRAQLQWVELYCHIAWCDERITAHVKTDEHATTAERKVLQITLEAAGVVALRDLMDVAVSA